MSGSLSAEAVAQYRRNGFLFPLQVFEPAEAKRYRSALEAIEGKDHGDLPRSVANYLRVGAHYVIPLAAEIALRSEVLDVVESILGPDLMIWSSEFFTKEAKTPKIVSWHQDLTYWGLGETDEEVTAWIALSPATPESGCMRFVAGSHNQRIQPHTDTFSEDNLLSRGQELAVEVDEKKTTDVILQPGQMSLHHGRMFHASGPNKSDDRRIAIAIRFVTPSVRQVVGERDYAMLARGMDRARNWINVAPPRSVFEQDALLRYEEIMAEHAKILMDGAAEQVEMYSA